MLRPLCLIFLLIPLTALAQGGPPLAASAPRPTPTTQHTYDQEPWVILHRNTVSSMNADGTGYVENTFAIRLQSDAGVKSFGVLSLSFASATSHIELHYARVRRQDGTVIETPVSGAMEQAAEVTRAAPFYSDLKELQLPIRSLRTGDILEWEARTVLIKPEAPGSFWGTETFFTQGVVLEQTYQLNVPAASHLIIWTNPKDIAPPTDTTAAGIRSIRWTHASLKPTVGPEATAAQEAEEKRVLTPAEELENAKGVLPSFAWTTFTDWAAVGAWYRELEADRIIPDQAVKAKVAELTAGKQTQEEKARALYAYVAGQVRYIGVAFGIGRFQPHTAADVLANQYGDCKDKHTLLAAMLSAAGIPSDAVLIGAGIRFNEAVPSPAAFNHLITLAHIDGNDVWLDTTAEVAPWRMLTAVIRDKSALAVPQAGRAVVAHTPAELPFPVFISQKVTGSLAGDLTSESHIEITFRGDDELIIRAALRQVSPAQYLQFIQAFVSAMGYGGTATEPEINHLDDTAQPISIGFHYHRVKEADWGVDRITANFYPLALGPVDEKHPPVTSIPLGLLRTEDSTLEIKLPDHWSAELPEAVHAEAAFGTCDVTFRLDKGTLYAERRLVILKDKLPQADWKLYKTWSEECGANSFPYVQLTHPGAAGALASNTTSNREAALLIEQANEAERQRDTARTLMLLDKAKALNPQQRNLWGTYGYRAYDLGMTNEAIEDYRKELQLHPDQTWVYAPMAEMLVRTGHRDQALAALRSAVAADPANLRANTMLIALLATQPDGRKESIAVGSAALKLLPADEPNNAPLALALATQQVAAGQSTEAAAILSTLLKSTTDTNIKNNAAYLLSETGLELPAAEAAERSVLDALTDETRSWTLDENPIVLRQKSSLLVASWDTMGWIIFREGRTHDARALVEPAWRLHQVLDVGRHLGDIALAEHDAPTAATAYELALSTVGANALNRPGTVTPESITLELKAAREGLARARAAGATSSVKDSHRALQELRILQLGPSKGHHGSAEYRMLIAHGRVEAIRPNTETTLANAEALFQEASFAAFTPPAYEGKLVLFGILNCSGDTCKLVLEP